MDRARVHQSLYLAVIVDAVARLWTILIDLHSRSVEQSIVGPTAMHSMTPTPEPL